MGEMVRWFEDRPVWQKWVIGAGMVTAVIATGGLAAYAIAQGGLVVAVGEVVVVAGPAAVAFATRA
jgi:hypothetical protein